MRGKGTITTIVNAAPADRAYRYHDRHVDDTQAEVAFVMLRNGWSARYDREADQYRVTTPSGLLRTYVLVSQG